MLLLIVCVVASLLILALGAGFGFWLLFRTHRQTVSTGAGADTTRSAGSAAQWTDPTPDLGKTVEAPPLPPSDTPRGQSASGELLVIEGPLVSQRFPIPVEGLTIGRHPENDLVLADELMVSRYHAVIVRDQDRFVLYDRDSANGTWVNGRRIFRHVLAPGDEIQIWKSTFVFSGSTHSRPSPSVAGVVVAPASADTADTLDGYVLDGLIGSGGMSEVYRARDAQGQTVAIKVLREADPYVVAKFVQEGNEIGPILGRHPGIVYVHKFGKSADGCLYIVMEYVDAPSLRKLIQGPLPEPEATRIGGQMCVALAYAHQHHIVHRDIKPENVLVSPQGVKILDFGIAKLTSGSTVTRDKIVGTPEYLSPEQACGDEVKPASDVYSVGIVLYEMLTGTVPFPRPPDGDAFQSALEVINRHLKERPERIQKRNPSVRVSRSVERVVMRALEKEAKDRFPSAREMAVALGCRESLDIPAAAARPDGASLLILEGPRKGQRIRLDNATVPLGRQELGSSNLTISRHHADICFRGGRYWLQDTSRNGTWVDDKQVHGEMPLRPGSVITIGDNVMQLAMEG